MTETLEPMDQLKIDHQQLAQQLLAQAKAEGVELVGPNGLLNRLIASGNGAGSRDGTMLDHIVESSPFKSVLYEEVIEPLEQYDRDHSADLLATLRAYCASGFNLSGTAKALVVQPNTVRYRLKRIHELTGQDPFVSNNLILLALALRAAP